MYLNPDLGAQLARQQQRQMLAEAEHQQRHQQDIAARTPTLTTAPAPASRPRRLAAVIGGLFICTAEWHPADGHVANLERLASGPRTGTILAFPVDVPGAGRP
jgi:hypothetical protein